VNHSRGGVDKGWGGKMVQGRGGAVFREGRRRGGFGEVRGGCGCARLGEWEGLVRGRLGAREGRRSNRLGKGLGWSGGGTGVVEWGGEGWK